MRVGLNRSITNNEFFEDHFDKDDGVDYGDLPSFWASIASLAILFLIIIAGSFLGVENIII